MEIRNVIRFNGNPILTKSINLAEFNLQMQQNSD